MALRVDVARLLSAPGERQELERPVVVDGLEGEACRVDEGVPIECRLVIESILEGLEIHGSVDAPWVGECRRCLRDVEGRLHSEVREIFEDDPVEGETYPIDGDHIDLEPLLRETVMLALPLSPLCREDCAGPDPDRFPTGPASPHEDAEDPERDPRWAALDELDLS